MALAAIIGSAGCATSATGVAEQSFSNYSVSTRHHGVFNGVPVDYSATFDDTLITNEAGEETASLFATGYVRENVADRALRPVIFIWSGGPSASSQTLHMAGFSPRRLDVPLDVTAPIAAPYETGDNVHTLLDVADLVFVDPANTGFSRILPAGDAAYFHTADGDAESVAQLIEKWLSRNGRGDSPAYVLGSSYGSIRAVLVAGLLAKSPKPLDGAILFSQGVNLVETTQRSNNLIGYASNLSQQAAVAWYHGRTALQDKTVGEVIAEAQTFAMGEYLVALGQGSSLPDTQRREIASRLAELTGVSSETYLESGLMISKSRFRRELLRDQGLVVGATDARYTAPADSEEGPASPTQGVAEVQRAHMLEFLRVTLPMEEYRAFAPGTGSRWDYGGTSTLDGSKLAPDTVRTVFADYDYPGALVPAFEANEDFRVMIATGIYDLLTTVGPARLLASDPDYPEGRVEMHEYIGGHAFYSNDGEFERLANDIRNMVSPR
ncbi:MAG: S10 family serine carboxypeptidase-like protein [Woeseiaceae bacterium]